MHKHMQVCMHACMHNNAPYACMPTNSVHACMHTVHAHMHTCMHKYMHTCTYARMHTCPIQRRIDRTVIRTANSQTQTQT